MIGRWCGALGNAAAHFSEKTPWPGLHSRSDLCRKSFGNPAPVVTSIVSAISTPVPIVCSFTMASEIGLLSKRLLTSCTIRNPSLRVSQALRQPLWAQPRTFATSSVLCAPPRSGSRSASAEQTSKPAPTVPTQTPPPPPSSDAAASESKKPGSPFTYDATSDAFDISKIIAMESDEFLKKHYPTGQQEPPLRTRPSTGRTVHLTSNVDLVKALKQLDFQTKKNKTRRMFQLQRFHERPGKKRKRLNSERWRARFKDGFKATVQRVQELKNQGW
ncbi:ribosomal protein s21 [Colletotrichum tofieldiae]|uniref:Ribosomal protein s21 n=2 Tax=Colletotrichum spaethianum species complex TaxID=2707349 RepID=A0A166NP30_9PEZI|nr:ribosomal protein s21 [Colletotrichum tofieldiae]